MSNTNNTMQTQTSNTLHNAIMEAGGKDRPLMLAPDKDVPVSEGSTETTTERYMENYKNVSQDIRNQLNAKTEAVQTILTGIYNDIYSTVDTCPNACEMWKAIERSQQASTRNRGKAIVNSPPPIYDQEPLMVAEDDKMDDTDDEPEDQELEAYYMYMAQIQEVNPDAVDNSGPIFDTEPLQKVQNNDHYNVFAIESEHPEQSKSVNDTYPIEQDEHNVIIDSLDMSYDRKQIDQNDDDDDDLANERDLLTSLIEKLKCEIDDSKNRNKFLETSNKALVEKLKGEIEDFKNKNESLESSNNHFKEANNELSKTNELMYKDLKKFQAELDRHNDVKYASKIEIDCAKAKEDLMSYKMEFEKSSNRYTQKINDLNQTISEMKKELFPHQETISILSQQKEAQIKFHKTREDKELDKVIALENKVKFLDNIVYKTCQSVQAMNMLNRNCKTNFANLEFLKKAQRANPRMYDIEEMVADLRYFNSLELEVDSLKSQLETQKTQFLNEIDRLSREYYYADHMNVILGVYTKLDEDLKAELQDKGIAISELKKLIEKLKGKFVDTNFEKSLVIRQPNAFKSQRPSILGKPTIFSDSLERKDCSKSKSVSKNNVANDFSKPVTAQILPQNKKSILKNTNVLAPEIPQLKSNQMEDKVLLNNSQGKKQEVEDHHRNVKFTKNKTSITACYDSLKAKILNVNFVCATCGKCVFNVKHDMCVLQNLNDVNSRTKMPIAVPVSTREPKCTVNQSIAKPFRKIVASESTNQKPRHTTRKLYDHVTKTCSWWYPKFTPPGYKWKPKSKTGNVNPNDIEIILFIVDSRCSKHMAGNLKLLTNFVEKFMGTVKFGNDQIAPILGYGDLVQGAVTIKRVYYVEGLNHNLFFVGQFCDADLNSHKLDLGARVAHSAIAYNDLPWSLSRCWHASKPSMLCVLTLREMGHGSGNLRKIFDKSSIETSMPEKTSDSFDCGWVR
nr:integrase, catalytic region, zinc finger, CCHC-type, peptidase aspartic, catalytic [Tanacetum cinerariifolium]